MKRWHQYEEFLTSGEWHVHTSYGDGHNTVDEMCQRAVELKIPLLVFSEHVRKTLTYDFDQFLGDIEAARSTYPQLTILSGCEAKVLHDGSLDVADDVLAKVDVPLMAFHSFRYPLEDYLKALACALANPAVNIWAHSWLYLQKLGTDVDNQTLAHILDLCREHDVLLEYNRQYDLTSHRWREAIRVRGLPLCRGSNIHETETLRAPSAGLY